jgi:hypothetical protein
MGPKKGNRFRARVTDKDQWVPKGYDKEHEAITGGHRLTNGSYVYQYFIADAEGNTNNCWNHHENRAVPSCKEPTTYVRLVTVTDNLPPVITRHNRQPR